MYSYIVYGLLLSSPIELPEFIAKEGDPDIVFRHGSVVTLDPDAENPYIQTSGDLVYINLPDIARFLINAGREVTMDIEPAVDARLVRAYIQGLVMGVLLSKRGFLTFHASAVTIGKACVAFVGKSGAGKSTTAAFFHAAGHAMMTDDILALTPIDSELIAVPGFPRLQLMPDSAEFLGESPKTGIDAHPALTKHIHRITEGFATESFPLKRVYLLESADKTEIVPVEKKDALKEVLVHWNGSKFGMAMIRALGPEIHLRHCVTLAAQVPVCRLRKTNSFADLQDIVRMVEEDIARDCISLPE